jgi:adenylate cyclase
MADAGMVALVNYQALPLTLVALAGFILFVGVRRTRGLLLASINQADRTARLSRYFSPNLAARLAESASDQLLAGRRQPAAVLFIDIRGVTALGEAMEPEALSAFLAEYRHRLIQPVFALGGTVDKFMGDAIMAVFGSPIQSADDAGRALRCAVEILDAARRWSLEREQSGQPPVAIGIGAHYGEVFAGALGCEHLLEYTVIGDTVNVAQRLERLSREVDSSLVVSEALLRAAGADKIGKWRRLPTQQLKGHSELVEALCLVC